MKTVRSSLEADIEIVGRARPLDNVGAVWKSVMPLPEETVRGRKGAHDDAEAVKRRGRRRLPTAPARSSQRKGVRRIVDHPVPEASRDVYVAGPNLLG
jgi:hypothetical protein